MKLSRWCHVSQKDEICAIFNSLTLEVVYTSKNNLDKILSKTTGFDTSDELVKDLIDQNFLVEDDHVDDLQFTNLRKQLQSEITLEILYLLVTDGCNLRCSYCFEDSPSLSRSFRSTQMTNQTVRQTIDLFAQMSSRFGSKEKSKIIHLYGGEPLINRKAVHEATQYVSKLREQDVLPEDTKVVIVTNGILMKEIDVQLFSRYNVTVGLSIDGPAFITDFYRLPKKKGTQVTEHLKKIFRLLKKHGVNVGLSVTLTPKAIEHFDEFLDFFITSEFKEANGVSFNLLHFTPNIEIPDNYYEKAVECQIKAFEKFRQIGIYEDRVMRKVDAFIDQKPIYADCGVIGNQLVVAPDGRIGVCQDFVKPRTYFPRSVYDENHDDLLDALFTDWQKRSPFFMDQCKNCPAIGICGGGCPASAEIKTGDRWNLDERACFHSKQILEWLIWDCYKQIENQQ